MIEWLSVRRKTAPDYPRNLHQFGAGRALKPAMERAVNGCLEQVFGYYAIVLGDLAHQLTIQTRVRRAFAISANAGIASISSAVAEAYSGRLVRASLTDLPFQPHSIDTAVAVFELDFSADPHRVLREIDTALTREGQLILVGCNPLSVGGLWHSMAKRVPGLNRRSMAQARFFSYRRVVDWLSVLGFEVLELEPIHHWRSDQGGALGGMLSKFSNAMARLCNGLPPAIRNYLPILTTTYIIRAQKREVPLTPERTKRWSLRPQFSPVAANKIKPTSTRRAPPPD